MITPADILCVFDEALETFIEGVLTIPLTNNDWAWLPEDEIMPRLWEYLWLLFKLCGMNLALYGLFAIPFYTFLPDFRALSFSKRIYTLKNLTKSLLLCILAFCVIPPLWEIIKRDTWSNAEMFFWGTFYTSTDLSGLLWVPDLSPATRIHHLTVCLLGTVSAFSDYRVRGLHQALLTLTYFSAVPYIVNTYLGLRHLEHKRIQKSLISSCFYVYAFSILLNFWMQHMYIFYLIPGGITWIKVGYLLAYYNILRDDLHLMSYFRFKAEKVQKVEKAREKVREKAIQEMVESGTNTAEAEAKAQARAPNGHWDNFLYLLNRSPFLRDRSQRTRKESTTPGTTAESTNAESTNAERTNAESTTILGQSQNDSEPSEESCNLLLSESSEISENEVC